MAENKTISADTKLRAFALFTMAQSHYDKCRAFEAQLAELLGYPDDEPCCGCLSDEIYSNGKFETGLRKEGFATKPNKTNRKKHG